MHKQLDTFSDVKIYKTTNYAQFWMIKGNRPLIQNHLKELTLSVMSNNLLDYNPIVVTHEKGIIDGQHRLEIAKNNKLKISYIMIPEGNIDQVRQLNRYNKSWNGLDFINSYAILGNEQYQWLVTFIETYTIPYSVGLHLVFGENRPSMVRNGLMKIPEGLRKRAEKRANTLVSIRPFVTKKGSLPKGFIAALNRITDADKEKEIITAIGKTGGLYPKVVAQEAYQQLLSFAK